MKTRIISVTNNKGGVGKSTTTLNLASYLSLAGKKILLVDLDPQANLTTMIGIEKDSKPEKSIAKIFRDKNVDIKSLILKVDDLYILTADSDLQEASEKINENPDYRLQIKLRELVNNNEFDYIIIDTPPSLGVLTRNGVIASKEIIIPIQAEHLALEGTADVVNFIYKMNSQIADLGMPEKSITGALITMYDGRIKQSENITQTVQQNFKSLEIPVFKTLIRRNSKISEAPAEKQSIFFYDKSSRGSKDYEAFAKEIIAQEE